MNNRIIKFRAWDVKEKKFIQTIKEATGNKMSIYNIAIMLDGTLLQLEEDLINDQVKVRVWYPEHIVITQYTGLKDKNGKEIYEGDIVKFAYYDKSGGNGEVSFKKGAFYVHEAHPFNQLNPYEFEVIGNIFENPEPLQEK